MHEKPCTVQLRESVETHYRISSLSSCSTNRPKNLAGSRYSHLLLQSDRSSILRREEIILGSLLRSHFHVAWKFSDPNFKS
jgi:hypothetical protein